MYLISIFVIVVFVIIYGTKNKPLLNKINEGLQYFCIKDSGNYVSVWPKNPKTGEYIEFDIAGIAYRKNINNYLGEFVGTLIPEPKNPHDRMAIKILAPDGHHVGYVPKDVNVKVHQSRILPCKCYCYIGKRTDSDGTKYYSDCFIKI